MPPIPARAYPLPPSPDDKRFTLGMAVDVAEVLARYGYPPIENGADLVDLQQALHRFLYAEPSDEQTAPPGGMTRAERNALTLLERYGRHLPAQKAIERELGWGAERVRAALAVLASQDTRARGILMAAGGAGAEQISIELGVSIRTAYRYVNAARQAG